AREAREPVHDGIAPRRGRRVGRRQPDGDVPQLRIAQRVAREGPALEGLDDDGAGHWRESSSPWHSGARPMRHKFRRDGSLLTLALGVTVALSSAEAAPGSKPRAGAGGLSAPKLDVRSWELANGLRVLFLADHKAPIATVQVFYHVGSKDEHVGVRGVAHMFEHMMFKGSEHVPPEEHARLLKEVGGQSNAFTTEDLTAYHDTVPPSYVNFALQLKTERIHQLKLFAATVDSE